MYEITEKFTEALEGSSGMVR